MGSGGSKRRKRKRPLPKVGTPDDVERSMHARQHELAEDIGVKHRDTAVGRGLTWLWVGIAGALVLAAVLYLALR